MSFNAGKGSWLSISAHLRLNPHLQDFSWETFKPKSILWIPAAGVGERLRPYTYARAKAMLPISENYTISEKLRTQFLHCNIYPELTVVTTWYRPFDFQSVRTWSAGIHKTIDFNTEVLHNTACDFDMLRIYFPEVTTWYISLGDIVIQDMTFLTKVKNLHNSIVVTEGVQDISKCGVIHETNGCMWFREKKSDNVTYLTTKQSRWRGILKFDLEHFKKPFPPPFLCSKRENHPYHGKSFQETYLEAMIGNYAIFDAIQVGEEDIISVGTREKYERYMGRSEQEIMATILQDGNSGSRSSYGARD